ncbi:hypothetical protein CapIbe_000340 [Capra ibex]
MRGTHWRRLPGVFLSCLCSCLCGPAVLGAAQTQWASLTSGHCPTSSVTEDLSPSSISHTPPTSSELMTGTTSANITNVLPIKCKQYISNDISNFSKPPDSEHEDHERNTNHHCHSCENINSLIIDMCTQIYRRHVPEDISFKGNNHFIPTLCEAYTYSNIKNMEDKVLSRHHCRKPEEHITNSTETYPSSVNYSWTRETIKLTPFHHFYQENISVFSEPPDSKHENHQWNPNHHHHSCENINSLIIDTCTQIYRRHFPEDIPFRKASMKTTSGAQTTTVTAVRTSTLSSSTRAHKSTEDTSQRTSSSAPGPAVTWSPSTRFTSHPTPLSVTSTSPTFTGSTVKAETSAPKVCDSRKFYYSLTVRPTPVFFPCLPRKNHSLTEGRLQRKHSIPPLNNPPDPYHRHCWDFYRPSAGDQEFVRRTVDFTSPLFKPQIGFPLGSLLWNSLYFTDNGQIVFPKSDYQIFSYLNPPLRGFSSWDSVAMVAPFWDDADFSSSRGTIFYQEYETLYDDYNTLVQKVESSINMLTKTRNYKARILYLSSLKRSHKEGKSTTAGALTVRVESLQNSKLAFALRGQEKTNTYQAILSMDGSRSYALFLYQSGGMQWNVSGRPGNPVLMGFSSGDGYFKNSQLTSHPVWEKYRPDQFLDSNSGLRGLQIYKLHREKKPDYRLRCLQWLKRQPQWPSWGWNQISCPCSWIQGVLDLRFQFSRETPLRHGCPHHRHPRPENVWACCKAAGSCAASPPGAGACAAATDPGESCSKAGECRVLGNLTKNWSCKTGVAISTASPPSVPCTS